MDSFVAVYNDGGFMVSQMTLSISAHSYVLGAGGIFIFPNFWYF